jgi:muramoyltetrapeptide carboxypeptidase
MPGDTVGIAAPASSFDDDLFHSGIEILRSMGFQTLVPDDIFIKKGYLAGSDASRARVLNRLFADPAVKAVMCARGGFGSMRILPMLDFEAIRKNPKIFIGFSDISALLWGIYRKCGLAVYHGPVITTLGNADPKTRESLSAILLSDRIPEIKPEKGITLRSGTASGTLIGGNLTTLCHLTGTAFAPDFGEHILLLEDRGEAAYRIDRMLTQMKLAGCFDRLAGLVLGSFDDCGREDEIFRIVRNIFKEKKLPILAGIDAGHGMPNITVPFGISASLDADRQVLSFNEPFIIRSAKMERSGISAK